MSNLLIVYHSQSGSCSELARAACDGANLESQATIRVCRAIDAGVQDLCWAGGVLLVTAENSGSLAGGMKDFLDRIFYPAIKHSLVLPYALLVSAGNDGRGAVQQAERILSGIPFTVATEPLIFRGELQRDFLSQASDVGQAFAAGLEMGIF
ncbi:MAG: multimeric flavodoxin WrbA [Alcanivorax sp.]|jgi:multimeric flavodoxin WrbA